MKSVSYIILGFSAEEKTFTRPFCVLSWLTDATSSTALTIMLSRQWQEIVPDIYSTYVYELINDLIQRSIDNPDALIRMVEELSVGPIQTLEVGSVPCTAFNDLLTTHLGEVYTL